MDDRRTHDTLDALADLFLTGTTPVAPGAPAARPVAGRVFPATPTLPSAAVNRPVRLGPKLRPAAAPPARAAVAATQTPKPFDPDDAMREALRFTTPSKPAAEDAEDVIEASLAEEDIVPAAPHIGALPPLKAPVAVRVDEPPAPRDAEAFPRVEAVFLGNLPGFASPWLTQYADALARIHGHTALVHVDDEHIDLELVLQPNAREDQADTSTLVAWVKEAKGGELIEILDGLATLDPTPVRNFLIHLAGPRDASAADLARAADHWTLLTGVDEAASAHAENTLAELAQTTANPQERGVAVAVMGADPQAAQPLLERLNHALDELIPGGVRLAVTRRQMQPVHVVPVASFKAGETLRAELHEFLDGLTGRLVSEPHDWPESRIDVAPPPSPTPPATSVSVARPAPAAPPTPPAAAPRPAVRAVGSTVSAKSEIRDQRSEIPFAVLPPTAAAPPRSAPPPRPVRVTPPVTPPVAPAPPAAASPAPRPAAPPAPQSAAALDLAQFLRDFNVVAMPARCPSQPHTQLVIDDAGVLHILRQHDSQSTPGEPAAGDLRQATLDLVQARAWAVEHLALLRLTPNADRLDPAAAPVLHLFTDDARHAVAITHRLGEFLRLHLLQEVQLGDSVAWFATELN